MDKLKEKAKYAYPFGDEGVSNGFEGNGNYLNISRPRGTTL